MADAVPKSPEKETEVKGTVEDKERSPKSSPSKIETNEALQHLVQGKRHLLVRDVHSAVNSLQEACRLLAEQYGETADPCGEAYFVYGKALLELSRIETGVLGNALEGVPEGEDADTSQTESPDELPEEERLKVIAEVDEALEENYRTLEKAKLQQPSDVAAGGSEEVTAGTVAPAAEDAMEVDDATAAPAESNGAESNGVEEEGKTGSPKKDRGTGEDCSPEKDREMGKAVLPPGGADASVSQEEQVGKNEEEAKSAAEQGEVNGGHLEEKGLPQEHQQKAEAAETIEPGKAPDADVENLEVAHEEKSVSDEAAAVKAAPDGVDPAPAPVSNGSSISPESDGTRRLAEVDSMDATPARAPRPDGATAAAGPDEERPAESTEDDDNDEESEENDADEPAAEPEPEPETETGDKEADTASADSDGGSAEAEAEPAKEGDTSQECDTEEGDGDGAKEGGDGDEEEEEDVPNIQLAWEVLELAKIIFTRQAGDKTSDLKLSEVYQKLGEVSIEAENYTQAVDDLNNCLNIQKKHLPPDDRLIAETHYHLGVAHSLANQYTEAIASLRASVDTILARVQRLQKQIVDRESGSKVEHEDPFYKEEDEIKELEGLLPDIREKITDMEDMKSEAQKKIAELFANGAGPSTSAAPISPVKAMMTSRPATSSAEAGADQKEARSIGHLVKRKRASGEPAEDEAKRAKQENGHADTNGHVSDDKGT